MEITINKLVTLVFITCMVSACSEDTTNSRIVIGNGFNTFVLNELQYQNPFVVQVTKPDGGPAAGARVNLSLRPVSYRKGFYEATDIDVPMDGIPDEWQLNIQATCPSEDTNQNGILDTGEDGGTNGNGNGVLDPANSATISEHPSEKPTITPGTNQLVTDSTGFGYFSLTYPKSEGSWSTVLLTATLEGGGPGNTQSDTINLPVIIADIDDPNVSPPGGTIGAYGSSNNCQNPN